MVELGSHAATERVAMVTLRLTCVARPDSIPTSARYVPWEPEAGDRLWPPGGHPVTGIPTATKPGRTNSRGTDGRVEKSCQSETHLRVPVSHYNCCFRRYCESDIDAGFQLTDAGRLDLTAAAPVAPCPALPRIFDRVQVGLARKRMNSLQ